ncbi:hypothetical protein SAMN05421820_107244 [Pedobacter steynii]|uniref:Uncharacterized protein n=1 Tax=Pedobacter steynii TaxID=430522 RepID=A0A1H0AYD7_9SPHI|nr:hypothetical protein [Pedobacter steynii]NQX41220.1 hypothetical protein [Pedobacter steynii]SDN38409.1 hypothetical protein SAMN05421820_107244 [Pedobacter steynii]
MSKRINDEFGSILNSKFRNRDYYFHPDEDFREDKEWAREKSVKSSKKDDINKKSPEEASQ